METNSDSSIKQKSLFYFFLAAWFIFLLLISSFRPPVTDQWLWIFRLFGLVLVSVIVPLFPLVVWKYRLFFIRNKLLDASICKKIEERESRTYLVFIAFSLFLSYFLLLPLLVDLGAIALGNRTLIQEKMLTSSCSRRGRDAQKSCINFDNNLDRYSIYYNNLTVGEKYKVIILNAQVINAWRDQMVGNTSN